MRIKSVVILSKHLVSLLCLGLFFSCTKVDSTDHLFPSDIIEEAQQDMEIKFDYLHINKDDFLSSLKGLSAYEREAMIFLYAYTITPDMLDYSPEFYLTNIKLTKKALDEMPWGSSIPSELVRHFILPIRVNNEALDNSREIFYTELKDRVKNLSMKEAVLEVNHWCNEHVTYEPSDSRTSSPIYTMQNGLGRCGEESTYTVAALRSIGIPARQVYTPRWAHTDNNHAWVEAWVDGQWYYLGACEPAPVLNNAWFDAPVKRAMMLHTKAFGRYSGDEEALSFTPTYTELNLTPLYVPTDIAKVKVVDSNNKPLEGINVVFRLYNHAEFFPLASRKTDEYGKAHLETGLGDLLVSVGNSPDAMALSKVTSGGEEVTVKLTTYDNIPNSISWKLVPPEAQKAVQDIDTVLIQECNDRIAINDSIRNAYINTFPTKEDAQKTFKELKLTNEAVWTERLLESRGHSATILRFIKGLPEDKRDLGVNLLSSLTKKDMHDVPIDVLTDVIQNYRYGTSSIEIKYVLNPRVYNEQLFPVSAILNKTVDSLLDASSGERLDNFQKADLIADFLKTFLVDDKYNPIRHPMSPQSVIENKLGDPRSLAFTFVRLCRSAGIPTAFDVAIDLPKVYDKDGSYKLYAISPEDELKIKTNNGTECNVKFAYKAKPYLSDPKYYYDYTLGYVNTLGQIITYDFADGIGVKEIVKTPLEYEDNFVVTGTRLADGTVLAQFRKINCGGLTQLTFDEDKEAISVIGSMNPEQLYFDYDSKVEKSLLSSTGRGYFVLCIGREHHEPTDHILRDMNKDLIDEKGKPYVPMVVLMESDTDNKPDAFALLPQAYWGRDIDENNLKMLANGTESTLPIDLPFVAVCDTFGRIVFVSQGYTIGIGQQIKRVVTEVR